MLNKSVSSPKHQRLRWLCWFLGGLFTLAVAFHFAAPSIVTSLVNRKLPEILNTEVSLGAFQLNLIKGRSGLTDLVIHQQGTTDETPLLAVRGIQTQVPLFKAITAHPVIIDSLKVDRLELYISSDNNGTLNFTKLGHADPTSETTSSQDDTPVVIPAILLRNLQATELSLRYVDHQNNQDLVVTHFNVELRNLRVTPNAIASLFPQISLDAINMDRMNLSLTLGDNKKAEPTGKSRRENVQEKDSVAAQNTAIVTPLPDVWVKAIKATQFKFQLLDQDSDLDLLLENFNLEIDNLLIGNVDASPLHADLRLDTNLRGIESSSRLQMDGRIGPIRSGQTPAMQLVSSLVGFELDTIAPVLKSDAVQTLGKGLDLGIMLEIRPGEGTKKQGLGGEWQLTTSKKIKFNNKIKEPWVIPSWDLPIYHTSYLWAGPFA